MAEDSVIDRTVTQDQSEKQIEVVQVTTMNLNPPPHFVVDGARADDFNTWLDSYTMWEVAMELSKKDQRVQAATFQAVLGPQGQKLLATLKLDSSKKDSPEEIRQALKNHFAPKTNHTFERYEFNRMTQQPNERVTDFVTRLKQQIEKCAYFCTHCQNCGQITDMLLIDRLILGNRNPRIKERLLQTDKLSLDKVIEIIRAAEETSSQLKAIKSTTEPEISRVKVQHRAPRARGNKTTPCRYCGQPYDKNHNCPARDKTCHKCHRKGHFSKVCQATDSVSTKTARAQQKESVNDGGDIVKTSIGCNRIKASRSEQVIVTVLINGHKEPVLLDTGAESSLISERTFRKIGGTRKLPSSKRVTDWLGKFQTPAVAVDLS